MTHSPRRPSISEIECLSVEHVFDCNADIEVRLPLSIHWPDGSVAWDQGSGVTAHLDDHSTDRLQQTLRAAELEIARLRASKSVILSELDRRQVATADGARTLTEWTAAALDVEPSTARSLVDASRMEAVAGSEYCSFDRTVAMSRLAASGADEVTMRRAWGFDLSGVARISSRRRPTTAAHERSLAEARFLVVQPRLDRSAYRITGQLPGLEGENVAQVPQEAADSLPTTPGIDREPLTTRQADGLVDVCQRAVDGGGTGDRPPLSARHLSIFLDANDAAPTNGEAGVWPPPAPEWGRPRWNGFSAKARSMSLHSRKRAHRSPSAPRQAPSPLAPAATCSTATVAPAPSMAADPATGSSPTTSNREQSTATTIPTTSPHCAISITTSSSTDVVTTSTPTRHHNAAV